MVVGVWTEVGCSSKSSVLIEQNLLLTGVTSSLNLREIPSAPTYSSLYFYSKFGLVVQVHSMKSL